MAFFIFGAKMAQGLIQEPVQSYEDGSGKPLSGGKLFTYAEGTLTPKATYQDSAGTIPNTNPIILNARGEAVVYGSGKYRMILQDSAGATIWDHNTQDPNAGLTGSITDAKFVAGVDFTAGTTTSLTLPAAPGSAANTWVFFDAAFQADDQIASVVGTTLTFVAPIPVGVQEVNVKIGTTVAVGTPGAGTVADVAIAAGSKLYNRISNIIDVKDYGAVGDGVHDDTQAFVDAIAAAVVMGGAEIFVPPGKYLIKSTLTLQNGVSLRGQCGAPAFGELSLIAVSEIRWGGAVGGTMLTTVAKWSGRIDGILLEGNYSAATLFHPISPTGSLFQNFNGQHSTQTGWLWDTDGVTPSSINTIINCSWHDHQNIAVQLTGQANSPVTLNVFIGCRYNGAVQSLRILQFADTNQWYGGRIEGGSSYGLVVNEAAAGLNTDSLAFYGVTFDGTNIAGSTMCYIGKPLVTPPPGGGNTVAAFRDCHFTQSTFFNGAPAGANIKVMDCPFFGNMFGGNGDHAIPQNVSIGASPFTYTNQDPYAEMVNIQGGSISGISFVRAGVTTAMSMTSGLFHLNPGDALQVTYTVAPTVFFRYQI